jgi:outer membrane murein-binding lipoprotein Lpp
MSSNAVPQLRARLPRIADAAIQRARLTVVPRPRARAARAPRIPFVVLVSAVLLTGVVGLLLFNTSMQAAAFRETALENQASDLAARQEALETDVQALRDPKRIAAAAQRMGLVIPTTSAGVIDLDTGTISGNPVPAQGTPLPLFPPPPTKPAVLNPPPVTVTATPTQHTDGTGRSGRDHGRSDHPARNGAADPDRGGSGPRLGDGRAARR